MTTVSAGPLVEVPLCELAVRDYILPAPAPAEHLPAVRGHLRDDPVRSWLVGLSDGRRWGWWGPLPGSIARLVPALFDAAFPVLPAGAVPEGFGRLLRRATRHGHTGILAVAAGALELALWDLAAKRADTPVWALLGAVGARPVPSYATCFGVRLAGGDTRAAVLEVAKVYRVQKWAADFTDPTLDWSAGQAVDLLGAGRLALDFHGRWTPDRVRVTCAGYAAGLAWVEEPYPPEEVHCAVRGEFIAPHAAGEHCYAVADSILLDHGGVDIWQPDAVFCGGLTNFVTIVRAAAAAGARCLPHGGGLLPALHAAAAGEPIEMVENHLLLEPRRLAHLERPPVVGAGGGALAAPDLVGWCGHLRKDLVDA